MNGQDGHSSGTRPSLPPGILHTGVVAIARRLAAADVAGVADALFAGGIRAFELTLNAPEDDALRAIEAAVRHIARRAAGPAAPSPAQPAGGPASRLSSEDQTETPLAIGAGTVLTRDSARRAIDAGASFLVMPHTDPDLVAWLAGERIPALPGAATPTEVLAGWRAGAAAIKVFPASSLGASFVRELGGPFPDIPVVPSGGMTLADVPAFIEAGAAAVGIGSWLTGDLEPVGISGRACELVAVVAAARAKASGDGATVSAAR
ncbi:MAG: bifunctional 4-hydroxy-2-oxoglutarate aldolase/2-dehydro-3-deoxy-phosphogluconate aldolase [Candidatus Limnocylindrales bacterium]